MENAPIAPEEVCCVVVNWRAAAETAECLSALFASDSAPGRAVVVDNGSGDGSAEVLRARIAEPDLAGRVLLVESPENGGFAKGCNLGIAKVREAFPGTARAWWLLNDDARPEPGALAALLRALDAEGADFAGSRVVAFDDPSREISAGGWIDARTGASSPRPSGHPRRADYLDGASLLFTERAALALGPIPEDYFLYFEETDYCFRAREAGFGLAVAEDSAVRHRVGASTGSGLGKGKVPEFADCLQAANRVRFARRLRRPFWAFAGLCGSVVLRALRGQWRRCAILARIALSERAFGRFVEERRGAPAAEAPRS